VFDVTPVKNADWNKFLSNTKDNPPSGTLLKALQLFENEGQPIGSLALDLGCGAGRDSLELLRRGWKVFAIDANEQAIDMVRRRASLAKAIGIKLKVARFESTDFPECSLVNAAYSLPFCPPEVFPKVWQRVSRALKGGGRFSGQLFGIHDEWVTDERMNFHARKEVLSLLKSFEVESLEELEEDGKTSSGSPKHWHVFHIVARK